MSDVSRVLSADDVARWAEVADDRNPLHLDAAFAATTRFERPIVHGSLLFALVADALQAADERSMQAGAQLRMRFRAPVPVGSQITLEVRSGNLRLLVGGDEPVTITVDDPEEAA